MNSNTVNSAAATADLAAGLRLAAPQSSAAPARMMSAVVQFWLTVPLTSLILANRGIGAGSIGLFAMLPWLAVLLLALEIAPAHGLPRGLARVTLVSSLSRPSAGAANTAHCKPCRRSDKLRAVSNGGEGLMKARITWVEDRTFVGESGSGHLLTLGRAEAPGGGNKTISPMELMLIGAGGCTAFDVVHILEKGRDAITGCVAELDAERAETDPKVFTKIHIHFVVTGKSLDPKKVERAIQLSAEKYCSATKMLSHTAAITHDFEVRDG